MTNSTLYTAAADSAPRRWITFALLLVGVFLSPLDFFIVNVALPSIRKSLITSSGDLQLVISGYVTAYAIFLITGGRLGDIYGRRPVFLIGLVCFGLASALCGFAPSSSVLIIGRILQGMAAAVMVPQGLASIHALFPVNERPLALGLYGAALGLAAAGGQIIGGFLISTNLFGLGWRLIFLINPPVVVIVLGLGLLLQDTRTLAPPKLDFTGVFLSALTLVLLIVPLIEGRDTGWPFWAFGMLIASPMIAILFWRHETRVLHERGTPLVDPTIMRVPGLGLGLLAVLLFYAISVFFLSFSIYLQSSLGESPLSAGLAFIPFGVGSFLGPLISPYVIRTAGHATAPVGMALETMGFLAISAAILAAPSGAGPSQVALVNGGDKLCQMAA